MHEMLHVLVMTIGQWDEDRQFYPIMVSNSEEELQKIADTIEEKAEQGKEELLNYTDRHLALNFEEDYKFEMESDVRYNEFFRGNNFCVEVITVPMKRV